MDASETLAFIANRIRGLCDYYGININELAERSGLSPSTLYTIVNGKCHNPRLDTLRKVCKAIEINLKVFWQG